MLDEVIDELLLSTLEHARATRGVVVLQREDGQRIEAERAADGTVTVLPRATAPMPADLPMSIIDRVAQSREPVILRDAIAEEPFGADPYVAAHRPRSVLCLPLIAHTDVLGTLYLEHATEPDVFRPAVIDVVKLLVSQAAVSVKHALCFADLRRAERQLRLTIDTIPEMIWSARPDGVIDFVNQRWVDFGGRTAVSAAGAGDWDWLASVHPDDVAHVRQTWVTRIASGQPYELELRVRGRDGTYRWFMSRAVPSRDATGAIVRWYGTSVDIQAQKEAQETIRQQERELRTLLDAVPQQIFVLGSDLGPEYANQAVLDYHRSPIEAVSRDAELASRQVHHPDDVERLWEEGQRAVSAGVPFEAEARIRDGSGAYRWFLIRMNPFRDDEGRIVRWYGTRTDIDGRKQAEDRVRQDERELRLLFDLIPQHIGVLDLDGRFLQANRAALEYWGGTLEQLTSSTDIRATAYHPDDLGKVRDTIRALSHGTPGEMEVRFRRHDGQYRWYLVRYTPLRDDEGRILRWYGTGTDIEDRRRAEERIRAENLRLREEIDKAFMFEEVVGTSAELREVSEAVARVAPTDSTVLVSGETGTGKELVARAIHKGSSRAARDFVAVNCAAIPSTLIASELFGHEKGAFTGALQRRLGRFELADGGTIFLDEIGDLPPDTQLALLRVLQEREFERVGSARSIHVDVRVIAATNRDLQAAVDSGAFRADLFYRLNVFPIEVPPLRERVPDIPLLVAYFLDRYASKAGKAIPNIDGRTLELLKSYRWPGNVRELQNVVERAVIVCESDTLMVDESWLCGATVAAAPPVLPLAETLAERERHLIEEALADSRGRVSGRSGAAAKLGIPASTLESKIRALNIRKDRFKSA